METWLPWQPECNINDAFVILSSWQCYSFHGNEVWGRCLLPQWTSIPNVDSVWLKTKELLSYHRGCHGNLVTIATRYAADAYLPKKPSYQILTKSNLRKKSCWRITVVTIVTRYVADAYRLIEPPYQIWNQYDWRQSKMYLTQTQTHRLKTHWLIGLTKAVNSKLRGL